MIQMQIMANNHNVMMFRSGMLIAARNNSKLQLDVCIIVSITAKFLFIFSYYK
jgi:hypothetical protein